MTHNTFDTLELVQQQKQQSVSTIKLLLFTINKLNLALPVKQVQKVTKYQPLLGSGLSYVNLTHIGKQEVTIIDLHQKLFQIGLDELTIDGGYFIITKGNPTTATSSNLTTNSYLENESLGIRVLEAPSLIDVALSDIRTLPNSYRYADTLEIASHVAIIPQEDRTTKTIFILDLKHLIS